MFFLSSLHQAAFVELPAGRDLKCVSASVGALPLLVATSHLESPTGWKELHSKQRVAQCKQVLRPFGPSASVAAPKHGCVPCVR